MRQERRADADAAQSHPPNASAVPTASERIEGGCVTSAVDDADEVVVGCVGLPGLLALK